jgi:hypothetical protein
MPRRDYVLIAHAIREAIDTVSCQVDAHGPSVRASFSAVIKELTRAMKRINGNFDADRFETECWK